MPDLGIFKSKKAAFGEVNDPNSIELHKSDALSAPARQFLKGPPPHIFSTGQEDFISTSVVVWYPLAKNQSACLCDIRINLRTPAPLVNCSHGRAEVLLTGQSTAGPICDGLGPTQGNANHH